MERSSLILFFSSLLLFVACHSNDVVEETQSNGRSVIYEDELLRTTYLVDGTNWFDTVYSEVLSSYEVFYNEDVHPNPFITVWVTDNNNNRFLRDFEFVDDSLYYESVSASGNGVSYSHVIKVHMLMQSNEDSILIAINESEVNWGRLEISRRRGYLKPN